MRLDDSRARAMATRFVRECEEDAVAEVNQINRSYKVRKKLPHYEEYYRGVDSEAFLNKKVIGSNRYSVGVLQGLSGKSIKRESELARGDFDEDMAFLTNYYVNHYRGCIGWEVSTSLNISYHAIQRVYQRKIAAEMDFRDTSIFKSEVMDELRDLPKYACLLGEALLHLDKDESLQVDPVLKEISFPIPSPSGLFLCSYQTGSILTVKTYLADEQLSLRQAEQKSRMREAFEAFFAAPIVVEPPRDAEAAVVFAPQFQNHGVASFLFYWFSRSFDWWELIDAYQCESRSHEIPIYHFFQKLKVRDPFQGLVFRDEAYMDEALERYLAVGHNEFFHSPFGKHFNEVVSCGLNHAEAA